MRLTILYTPNTPADQDIEYLRRRLGERQIEPELLDADSRAGIALAELYDLTARPAVVATDSAGQLLQRWQGALPTADEIANYFMAA